MEVLDKDLKCKIILDVLSSLKELSQILEKRKFLGFPVRKPFYYLFSFPLNLIRLIIKTPKNIIRYSKIGALFYRNYFQVILGKYNLGFVHRDLFPDNILYSTTKHSALITDWESTIVSDSLYDLAQIAMIYYRELDVNLTGILKKYLANNSESRRFIGLAIFNSIQILVNTTSDHPVFKDTETFLDTLIKDISPKILEKRSLFEIINSAVLNLINIFYKITRFSKYSTKNKIILCYHSVGDTGWRYSVRTENFKKQLNYLNNNYHLVSLDELLKQKNGGIHVTFDDGYQDVIENALPLLEQIKATGTIFVLGDPKKANYAELDNNLKIANYDQIKTLLKKGWEVGSHSMTHADLGKLDNEDLKNEIINSKLQLEKEFCKPIRYFAYPKGIYSDQIVKYVKIAGYDAAVTTDGHEIKPGDDNKKLSRVSIEGSLSLDQFESLISPLGLFMSAIFMKILSFKKKYLWHYKN